MKSKTFIVLVEDNADKVKNILTILEKEGVEYYQISAIEPAKTFIVKNHELIDGIILDLGLPSANSHLINPYAGMEILEELKERKLNIPVLINSEQLIFIDENDFSFVFSRRLFRSSDVDTLREFLKSI